MFSAWKFHLRNCPHKDADWFLQGLCKGFSIGFDSDRLISAKRNLLSVYENPDIIDNYLKHEINYTSIAGPFKPFSETHINRVGIIPKGTPGK